MNDLLVQRARALVAEVDGGGLVSVFALVAQMRDVLADCADVLEAPDECQAVSDEGYLCTLPAGHGGLHQAWGSDPLRTWCDEAMTR